MAFGLTLLVAFAGVFELASGAVDFKALVEQLEKLNVEMSAVRREMIETKTACDLLHDKSMVGESSIIFHPSNFNRIKRKISTYFTMGSFEKVLYL